MRDLQIGLDAVDVFWTEGSERAVLGGQPFSELCAVYLQTGRIKPAPCEVGATDRGIVGSFSLHHDIERHRQPRRSVKLADRGRRDPRQPVDQPDLAAALVQ